MAPRLPTGFLSSTHTLGEISGDKVKTAPRRRCARCNVWLRSTNFKLQCEWHNDIAPIVKHLKGATPEQVLEAGMKAFSMTREELLGFSNKAPYVTVRGAVMWVLRSALKLSFDEINLIFNRPESKSVPESVSVFERRLELYPKNNATLKALITGIEAILENPSPPPQ